MINRELIRTKVVQLTYAYYQNGYNDLEKAEKELLFSLDKAYDLYHTLLALVVAVTKVARQRLEIAQQRAIREGAPAPMERFANNRLALQLEENIALREWMEKQKTTWDDDVETVRNILNSIEASDIYGTYMTQATEPTYEEDRDLWRRLYKTFIVNNDEVYLALEERSLYWNDDKDVIDTFVIKTIKRFTAESTAEQVLLPQYKDLEDRDFARRLFRSAIANGEQYQHFMAESSRNWDFSRLAYMDVVIMQIAIAEMLSFPAIPINVTINEYVDLAKLYSTPKSWRYINGMLDTIARYLNETGKMHKAVR